MAAKGVELASAYISLSVSTDKIPQQVRNALRGIGDVDVDVDAKTGGATANMARWRDNEERKNVNVKVDVDTKRAAAQVGGLRRSLESLSRSDFLKLNVGAAGIASLPALATGLAEVAAAMQQVAQAGLAVPGGIAGAVASIGTLVFGLSGVSDAYEAANKAADDAATSTGDQASQARAAMSASNGLRNAVVDETQARKDVARATRDARNELMDLNIEMRGGIISEKRAVLEAQKAREDLMSGNFTDVRDQLLRVEEADQRVIETRARNAQTTEQLTDANAKGVAGSDQVVAANERLVRSQQNVAEAQASVAASGPKASAAQEKAALAMSKLSPNAQEFVNALMGVQGPIMDLRNMVQDNIFAGLAEQLKGLTGKLMPSLEKGLGGISEAWNENINELFDVLGSEDNRTILERIFGNTAEAQSILTDSIEPIIDAVGTLAAAGSDSLPRLADAFGDVAERFANFIEEADKDGRLAEWIDEGIDALGDLGEIALNVGKMITGITDVTDGGFLQWLNDVTTKWQEWTNSTEGQEAIRRFFDEGRAMFAKWRPILEDIPGLFKGIADAAQTYIGALIEIAKPVVDFLADHPRLVELAAGAYVAFKGAQVIGSIATLMESLGGVSKMLSVTLPANAATGAAAMTRALNPVALMLAAMGVGMVVALDAIHPQEVPARQPGESLDDWLKRAEAAGIDLPSLAPVAQKPDPNDLGSLLGAPTTPGAPDPRKIQGPVAASPGGNPFAPGGILGGPAQSGVIAPADLGGLLFDHPGGPQTGGGGNALPSATYGLPAGSNSGGYGGGGVDFPAWVDQVAQAFGIKPSTYAGHQESNRNEAGYAPNPMGLNRGIDWSGSVENMQRFAEYLKTVPGMEQVIWQNPNTGGAVEIAGGRPQPGYFAGDLGGHQDHVHTRQSTPIPLPPWVRTYDQGGWWPSGTPGINTTGKPEYVLTPEDLEWMRQNGIDPASIQQHTGAGAPPGPMVAPGPMAPDAQVDLSQFAFGSQPGDQGGIRTEGYIPAGAGFSGKTGGGLAGGLINMGAQAIQGAIQAAADAGKMAATLGTFGAGAAAGPAAGAGIQMGADIAKRGVQWGADMASIGIGAVTEILSPFGAPRWLSDVDPTAFMPQWNMQPTATTTGEKTNLATQAVDPNTTQHGTGMGLPPGPTMQPGGPVQPGQFPGSGAPGITVDPNQPPPGQLPPPAQPAPNPNDPMSFLKMFGIFDHGGILRPNSAAINLSRSPEYVFNQSQWKTMEANASGGYTGSRRGGPLVQIDKVEGMNPDDVAREIGTRTRRAARQYSVRP